MLYLLLSFIFFLLTALVHVLVKRLTILPLGFVLNAIFMFWINKPLPLTGIVIYGLLVFLYVIYFKSINLNEPSPSAAIYLLIKNQGEQTEREVLSKFSDKRLVINRLTDLEMEGFIKKREGRLYLTSKSFYLIKFFIFYSKILGLKEGG